MTDSPFLRRSLLFVQMRNVEFPELSHPPYTPGYACSGVIDALGAEALHFKVGDEVLVLVPLDSKLGGCAEFTVQPLINMCTNHMSHARMQLTHATSLRQPPSTPAVHRCFFLLPVFVPHAVLKPSSLSHESACAVAWSGIQGMTSLHYQLRVKAGDRLLLCTSNVVSQRERDCVRCKPRIGIL